MAILRCVYFIRGAFITEKESLISLSEWTDLSFIPVRLERDVLDR